MQIQGYAKSVVPTDKNQNNDTSVQDSLLTYIPIQKFFLPVELEETSGLIYFNEGLYSHNDSGGEATLYRFDTLNGEINQRITITNAVNIDWEDLAQDESFVYVGDFGNNAGNRKDLTIYKLQKTLFPKNGDTSLTAEKIQFSFEDQNDFSEAFRNNDFDCEAMIAFGDNLYVFSKNWITQKCRIYSMPKIKGTHVAHLLGEFNANCLITGATINSDGSELALVGYVKDVWVPVMWLFKDFENGNFLDGTKLRFAFPLILSSQIEGIAFTTDNKLFISGEKTSVSNQRVFRLKKSGKTTTNNNN
jgi:hypothetical protein